MSAEVETLPVQASTEAPPSRPILRFSRPSSQGPGGEEDDERPPAPLRRTLTKSHIWSSHREKKNDILAMVGEFFGTFLFLWMAFAGAQSASFNKGDAGVAKGVTTQDNQTILFIALSFGMSLIVTAWVFFRITGAAFNTAVTFSLWLIGNLTGRRACLVTAAQFLGGITAAGLAKALTLGSFSVETTTATGLSSAKGLFIELFCTSLLCFTVQMTAAEKSKSTFLAPVAIGLALFCGHLASVGWTGAGINPARTFGPSVVNGHFTHNAWLFYLGRYLGALLATACYVTLKQLDYNDVVGDVETSNAEQSQEVARSPAMMGIHAIQLKTHSSVSKLHRTMSKKEKGASRENVQTV